MLKIACAEEPLFWPVLHRNEGTSQLYSMALLWVLHLVQRVTWVLLSCPVHGCRPSGLESCTITVTQAAGRPGQLALQPCPCPACQAAAGSGGCTAFWSGVRSLRVQAAGASLEVDSQLLRLLRRCTALRLEAGCPQCDTAEPDAALLNVAPAAGAEGQLDLQPWLAGLAPMFAATELQIFELQAACAALCPYQQPAGGWVLQARAEPAAWEGPRLVAAGLPRNGRWHERSAGLAAQLTRHENAALFQLRVWRCEE